MIDALRALPRLQVRSWCAGADPPIDLLWAGPHPRALWTGSGAQAAVVVLDLQLSEGKREFDSLQRLVDAGRQVVIYTQDGDKRTALQCIRLGALAYVTKSEGKARPRSRPWSSGHPGSSSSSR